MPRRTGTTTKEFLASIPLPQHGGKYTVIPHKFIIDNTLLELSKHGLNVEQELYRCSIDGNIASGIYYIQNNQDPELGMIFTWSNSYDKTMRFKCAVGAYVQTSKSLIIKKDMGSWGRKHTGTADTEALNTIISQIQNAGASYTRIIEDKEKMKNITVTVKDTAELIGRLYLEKELLTGEQMGIIKSQMKSTDFEYSSPKDSLWVFYNHISYALQKAHPKTWLDQQRLINWFLCEKFELNTITLQPAATVITSNPEPVEVKGETNINLPYKQITLEEAIEEIEKEQKAKEEPVAKVEETLDDFNFNTTPGMEDFDL